MLKQTEKTQEASLHVLMFIFIFYFEDNFLCVRLLRYKVSVLISHYSYSCIIHILLSFIFCSEIRILSAVWHHALHLQPAHPEAFVLLALFSLSHTHVKILLIIYSFTSLISSENVAGLFLFLNSRGLSENYEKFAPRFLSLLS